MEQEIKKCLLKGMSIEETSYCLCLDKKTILRIAKKILDKGRDE